MLTLAELQQFAAQMTGARFVREIGPFVLLQHPPGSPLLDGDERRRTTVSSKSAAVRNGVGIKSELSNLQVAMLPPMAPGGELRVGRAPDNDLILEDPSASKYHATLIWQNGRAQVLDLGSMNGTMVNALTIEPQAACVLRDGDVIAFGGVQFVFYSSPRIFDILSSSGTRPPTR